MHREPPATEEGWYALHDFRRIDWAAWREAAAAERDRALEAGETFLADAEAVADAETGQSASYAIQGHEADLLVVHLRPTMADIDALERGFATTPFAAFTDRADSFVSVTEASGYSERAREYFEGELDENSGLGKYIRGRIKPEIPDDEFVSFYPMEKRRRPEQNWYDLPFEERAEHVANHGDIGRNYGGKVTQMITGAMGMDDWEWGVTLWAEDLTDVKDLLAEMRYDQSTSKFADFGPFYVGRRLAPTDLAAFLAGERIAAPGADAAGEPSASNEPTGPDAGQPAGQHGDGADEAEAATPHPAGNDHGDGADRSHHQAEDEDDGEGVPVNPRPTDGEDDGDGSHSGGPPTGDSTVTEIDNADPRLNVLGVYEDEDYEAGDYGLLFYADTDAEELADDVADLRSNFEHYDRHVLTSLRAGGGRAAVVSIWTAKEAAETAAGFIGDLRAVNERYGGVLGEATSQDSPGEGTTPAGDAERTGEAPDPAAAIREELSDLGVYAGQPHGEDLYALVLYSRADEETIAEAVADLQSTFADEDDHVKTALYDDLDSATTAVVSLWNSATAADDAGSTLADLPAVVGRPDDGDGFTTMGMFYTVEPEHRDDFLATFQKVGEILADMAGHRETALLVNREADNDMFIASRWDDKEDAMAFFRSDEFAETVQWGRDVLADRPRHVFLA
jgi:chlorite dismutase